MNEKHSFYHIGGGPITLLFREPFLVAVDPSMKLPSYYFVINLCMRVIIKYY